MRRTPATLTAALLLALTGLGTVVAGAAGAPPTSATNATGTAGALGAVVSDTHLATETPTATEPASPADEPVAEESGTVSAAPVAGVISAVVIAGAGVLLARRERTPAR